VVIRGADRVMFPGVGAIRDCMAEIGRLQLDAVIRDVAAVGKPLLAVCVGLQALLEHSEENGGVDCIGLLPGRVKFFGAELRDAAGERLKVPHMGWSQLHQTIDHPLWAGIEQDARFYFVHSYHADCPEPALIAGTTDYGVRFHAALARGNVFAAQFHPEKSADAGLALLRNFVHWDGRPSAG
jgi:glutamine amidotransferase